MSLVTCSLMTRGALNQQEPDEANKARLASLSAMALPS